jgi:enterochelin esterase-like enzyme
MPKEQTWVALPENSFGDNLVSELVPWIDQKYQTINDREYRAIGGVSRGGNWAVRLGLLHWGTFGSIGAHSTPLFFGDLNRIPDWINVIPTSRAPRIYLDIGEDDNHYLDALKLSRKLDSLQVPHNWNTNPGLHNEDYWKAHLEDYLRWYSGGWNVLELAP